MKADQRSLASILAQTAPFSTVPAEELRSLTTKLESIRLNSGEAYYLEQNAQTGYVLSLRGFLVLQKEHKDRPCPVCIWLPVGGLWPVARDNSPALSVYVESVGGGLFGFLSGTSVKSLDEASASLRLALVRSVGLGLEQGAKQYSRWVHDRLSARIAYLLLELREIEGGDNIVPYTHQQLAKLLGTYRETVSSLVGEFRREGWIETRKGNICLLDTSKLERLANSY